MGTRKLYIFLIKPNEFQDNIISAGFQIEHWNDKTDHAKKAFANKVMPEGKPTFPVLGVHLLVGEDIQLKAYNLHRNLEENRVGLIEAVAIKA